MFQGILIDKDDSGYRASLQQISDDQLPEGDVTVRVAYSTLNFKDGLAITGSSPVVRKFPMVPGIDLAGTVESSGHPDYKVGDQVVLNGWGVGEGHWGGLAQKARLNGDWLIPLPHQFSTAQAMAMANRGTIRRRAAGMAGSKDGALSAKRRAATTRVPPDLGGDSGPQHVARVAAGRAVVEGDRDAVGLEHGRALALAHL